MTNDIRVVASLVDVAMREFICKNPDNKRQEDCEHYVMVKLMKETKGRISPSLAQQMVKLHRLPMEEAGFAMQCA